MTFESQLSIFMIVRDYWVFVCHYGFWFLVFFFLSRFGTIGVIMGLSKCGCDAVVRVVDWSKLSSK